MIKKPSYLLIVFSSILCLSVFGQPETVHFEYDNAGNRTARFVYRSMEANETDSIISQDERLSALIEQEEEKKESTGNFRIYPNPTRSNFMIDQHDLNDSPWEFMLFNSEGVIVSNGQLNRFPFEVAVGQLPQGTYYLRVSSAEEVQTFSIIKL